MKFRLKRTVNKRYFENNEGELFLEREKRLWYTLWIGWKYVPHESLDKRPYLLAVKLAKRMNEVRELLADLTEAERQTQADKEEVRRSPTTRKGYSEPFREKCNWFFGKPCFPRKPSDKWRGDIDNKLLNKLNPKQRIIDATRGGHGNSNPDPHVEHTVLKEHAPFMVGDLENMNIYDQDRQRNQNQGKKNKNQWTNRRKGEDDYLYEERMRAGNPNEQDNNNDGGY